MTHRIRIAVTNAFSINMLSRKRHTIRFIPVSDEIARAELDGAEIISAIGHPDLARVVAERLGVELQANRVSINFDDYDEIIVAQYRGPRLPEGATELPEGATIEFWAVTK